MTRFVYVRKTFNYNFPHDYELETQENKLYENEYYIIAENKGYYAIIGILWEVNNPVCIIPKTHKLALHQLKTIANYFIIQEYKNYIEDCILPDLQSWLVDEIENYDPEYQEPEDTEIPQIIEQMHIKYQELQELQKLVEQAENRIQVISEKTMIDDEEYTEYVVIV